MRVPIILIGLGLVLGHPTNVQALDPDVKCNADKVKEAAKYSACRLKAESKAIKKAEAPDFSKCDSKYSEKWGKVETKAGGACPTEGDEAAIRSKMVGAADTIVARLSGVLGFVDNCDGTITDNQTGLMWEKKILGAACLHCVEDFYTWFDAMSDWISEVNGHTDDPDIQAGLGGHTDWRLPAIVELQTLLLEPFPSCDTRPCIDPIFGPTVSSGYWSSTGVGQATRIMAWFVFFADGDVDNGGKTISTFIHVRAVRGGL